MTALARSCQSEIAVGLQISLLKGSLFSFQRICEDDEVNRHQNELVFEF